MREKGELHVTPEARRDVDTVLNLNARHLQRLRQSALQAALGDLARGKRRRESWAARPLQQILDELRSQKQPIDYQPLIEEWLERKLSQRA